MEQLKVTVVTSNFAALAFILYLKQRQQLAGVLIAGQELLQKQQLEAQLNQIGVSSHQLGDEEGILSVIDSWQSKLMISFCCSEKIPGFIASFFKYGAINIHASGLPNYRGADPIYWQIRHGETQLMLTAHRLEETWDTGAIVEQLPIDIGPYDTPGHLLNKVLQILPSFFELLCVQLKEFGCFNEKAQVVEDAITDLKRAPRVTEEHMRLDWHQSSARQLCDQIRACNSLHSGALLVMGQGSAHVLQASVASKPTYAVAPGTIIHISPEQGLFVALKDEAVRLDIVVNADGVLDGYRFANLCRLAVGMQFN